MEEKDFNTEENIEISEKDYDNTDKKKSAGRELLEWVQAIVIAVVLALVIRSFVFNVVKVDGQSMMPTLHNGDRMIVWRLGYEPKQGDIVVFNPPGYGENIFWIKRVIATEGQEVETDLKNNATYVDGKKLDESYINDCSCNECGMYGGDDMIDRGFEKDKLKLTVPEGCIYVMGDNRNHSSDSRVIGQVSTNQVIGKAVLRFWPFKTIKTY